MKPPVQFKWKGNHHLYYGIFIMIFGLFNWYMGMGNGELAKLTQLWQAFVCVGAYLIIDDLIEHLVTADTPLRLIYDNLIKQYLLTGRN